MKPQNETTIEITIFLPAAGRSGIAGCAGHFAADRFFVIRDGSFD
jgi:hypothetical protein